MERKLDLINSKLNLIIDLLETPHYSKYIIRESLYSTTSEEDALITYFPIIYIPRIPV